MMKRILKALHRRLTLRHFGIVAREIRAISKSQQRIVKVLDIGCGNGWYWREGPLANLVGKELIELHILDAATPPEELAEIASVHEGVAPSSLRDFAVNEFDFVTTFDLIEHFPKHDGYRLLYELDRISRFGSSVFTPNGFVWQPESTNNVFNAHLSGWTPRELRKLGWRKQYSAGGVKVFHGPYGVLKFSSNGALGFVLNLLSNAFGNLNPNIGFAFLGISEKKNTREDVQDLS
jgi:SAM-dependent methyltransferase